MGTIQHDNIPADKRHAPKPHSVTSHLAVPAADRGKFLRANPVTGELEMVNIFQGFPPVAGDPTDPVPGDTWYDTVTGRYRGMTGAGKVTFNVTPDE